MTQILAEIIEDIKGLSSVELLELKDSLISELGIEYQDPVDFADIQIEKEVKVEQTEFTVILTGFPPNKKIMTIKEIRALTGLGLVESKTAAESLPYVLKEYVNRATAEEIKSKFTRVDATVEIK